jgi:predicted transcriptional regulator YheO
MDWVSSPQLKTACRQQTLDSLKQVGQALVQTFGPHACEVVIHDLTDLEHSIIWIAGNVTNRQVGGPMTDRGMELVHQGQFQDQTSYLTYTDDGRTLKSSSVFLCDDHGRAWGAFCFNLDITPYLNITQQLGASLLRTEAGEVSESFSADVESTVDTMLAEVLFEYGKPLYGMSKADRLGLIQSLDRKGLFQMKRAVPILAKKLGVSRYTIYNYLNELRDKSNAAALDAA